MARTPIDMLRDRIAERRRRAGASPARALAARGRTPGGKGRAKRGQGPVADIVNQWWTRLLQAVYQGSLSEQEAEYESHSTRRDYVWNTVGTTVWGLAFPVLTVVATQLAGAEEAGMFSMAFVTGTLLMIAANYGVRNYQASDIDEAESFSSYQVNRWITSALALIAGILYCTLRSYDPYMLTISMGVYVYKIVDGLADVYEGRLQQADKLYLAGISQTLRSVAVAAVFSLLLFVTRSLGVAAVGMAAVAVATLVLVTVPLALLETDKSRGWRISEVSGLLKRCFPLFAALFLFNLIESVPKFVMEGALPYENQLYFNALYFPAQGILLTIGFIYKPQLLRLAGIWASPRRRKRFNLVVAAVMGVIVLITLAMGVFMSTAGIPLMAFMYGVDFERFRGLALAMVCAGGVTAAIDFLYAVVAILRRQGDVMRLYLASFAAVLVLSLVLVNLVGLAGAVASYLGTMTLLLVLLAIEYRRMLGAIARERNPFA